MGDTGDMFKELREERRALRERLGVECPECRKLRPKTNASILLPGQRCRVDGYRDPRPRQQNPPSVRSMAACFNLPPGCLPRDIK